MKFGIFYELQLPRPWTERSEYQLLQDALAQNPDLVLFNRELGYGFADKVGVDAIKRLRSQNSNQKMMLVSNYAEAQAEAVANGALPGFGKREIGSPRVTELLRTALGEEAARAVRP